MIFRRKAWLFCVLLCACRVEWGAAVDGNCRSDAPAGTVLIYTSVYRHVVEALETALREDLPAIKPQWYQAGSEKVAARLDAELAAGSSPADLLLTSDPAHFARLKHEGRLLQRASLGAFRMPRSLVDPDGYWVTSRMAAMVLAFRSDEKNPPKKIADLWSPSWKGESIVGDPLSSGTFFTSLAILEMVHGERFFPSLREANVLATGGNSTVMEKLLSKERRAGLVLLENVLAAKAQGEPIDFRIPDDGVLLVPGQVGILASSPHPAAAAAVEDWLLGEHAQRIISQVGLMHAPRDGTPPPPGAPPLDELLGKALKMESSTWETLRTDGAQVKARFGAAFGR